MASILIVWLEGWDSKGFGKMSLAAEIKQGHSDTNHEMADALV
jgi:hypothetical protein